jgi:hypothetical protein
MKYKSGSSTTDLQLCVSADIFDLFRLEVAKWKSLCRHPPPPVQPAVSHIAVFRHQAYMPMTL